MAGALVRRLLGGVPPSFGVLHGSGAHTRRYLAKGVDDVDAISGGDGGLAALSHRMPARPGQLVSVRHANQADHAEIGDSSYGRRTAMLAAIRAQQGGCVVRSVLAILRLHPRNRQAEPALTGANLSFVALKAIDERATMLPRSPSALVALPMETRGYAVASAIVMVVAMPASSFRGAY